MASGRMALGDAKSGRDVDPTSRPDSRLAFRRPGRQTHGAHRTQGIIFADGFDLRDSIIHHGLLTSTNYVTIE